jgi:glutaredoxin
MAITLYSNGCPKCRILKQRLDEKGIEYTESSDTNFLEQNKILAFPALVIDVGILKFYNAILWLKNKNNGDGSDEQENLSKS